MTTTSSDSSLVKSSPPPIAQSGPIVWLRKHLFNTWYNALLTVVLVVILLTAVWGILNWAFRLAEWAVIPNNLALFMSGLYPSAIYSRIWAILGVNVAMGGVTWGLLVRNQGRLFSYSILVIVAVLCAGFIIFPLTRPSALSLIGLVALTLFCAWIGKTLGQRQLNLSQWLSSGWFLVYSISLLILAGGEIRNSLLFLVLTIALSAWLVSISLKLLANFSVIDVVSRNSIGVWIVRIIWVVGSLLGTISDISSDSLFKNPVTAMGNYYGDVHCLCVIAGTDFSGTQDLNVMYCGSFSVWPELFCDYDIGISLRWDVWVKVYWH